MTKRHVRRDSCWEDLSDQERLVMLAVSNELLKTRGVAARGVNVMLRSGLSGERKFQEVVDRLVCYGLLSTNDPKDTCRGWLKMTGNNTTLHLVPNHIIT